MAKKQSPKIRFSPDFDNVADLLDDGKVAAVRATFQEVGATWGDFLAYSAGAFDEGEFLSEAAENGKLDVVKLLVELGENPNAVNEEAFRLAIVVAGESGHGNIVEFLRPLTKSKSAIREADQFLKKHANKAKTLDDKELLIAANKGDLKAFRTALEQGANPHASDKNATPLWRLLIDRDRAELLEVLFDKGVKPSAEMVAPAATRGAAQCLEVLTRRGLSPDVRFHGREKRTALMEVASAGRMACVQVLLKAGADVNAANRDGETALFPVYVGSRRPSAEVLLALIKAGANTNHRDQRGMTFLDSHLASIHPKDFDRFYGGLLKHGVVDKDWNRTLRLCIDAPSETVLPLLESTADINACGEVEHDNQLRALYKPEEDEWHQFAKQRCVYLRVTPLHIAAARGREDLVDWLLNHGANPDARGILSRPENGDRPTPMSLAIARGQKKIVQRLLAAGANPTLHVGLQPNTEYGFQSFAEYAKERKQPTIAKLLQQAIESGPAAGRHP